MNNYTFDNINFQSHAPFAANNTHKCTNKPIQLFFCPLLSRIRKNNVQNSLQVIWEILSITQLECRFVENKKEEEVEEGSCCTYDNVRIHL